MCMGLAVPFAVAQSPHEGFPCDECHQAGEAVTPENAGRMIDRQKQLCGECHDESVMATHSVEFRPSRPLPASLPLDVNGELTCSTCHDFHGSAPLLLRITNEGSALCAACHTQ
jgi:predicted CXXCH cytochrome family protein